MKIHGYAALTPSKTLTPFTYEPKELRPYEVLIKITHSGLCRTDLYMMENDWKRSTYPLLPGHEIVGEIVKCGPLSTKALGERVGAGWIYASCLHCPECNQGETNICQNKIGIYNHGRYGGFADHVVADSRFVFQIPKDIDSAHAAPLLCAGATVFAPLMRFSIKPDWSVGVIGIGGLGHLALQFYRAFGCEVSAISGTPSKEGEAIELGAHQFYTLEKLPKPMQFDFLLCTTDANLEWDQMLPLLKPNGILCFVSRPPNGLLMKASLFVSTQRTIAGSNNASVKVMNQMLAFAEKHRIAPKIEEMPLSSINEAIEKVRNNKARYRIVLKI